MSELLQFIIVAAFGAFCFGCGYLAFIVSRNRWRDEMIKRGVARHDWQTGAWEWGGAAERIEILNAPSPHPAALIDRRTPGLFHREGW